MPFSKPSESMFLTNVEEAVYYYGTWAVFLSSSTQKSVGSTPKIRKEVVTF